MIVSMKAFVVTQTILFWLKKNFPQTLADYQSSSLKTQIKSWLENSYKLRCQNLKTQLVSSQNCIEQYQQFIRCYEALLVEFAETVFYQGFHEAEFISFIEIERQKYSGNYKPSNFILTQELAVFPYSFEAAPSAPIAQQLAHSVLFKQKFELQLLIDEKIKINETVFAKHLANEVNKLCSLI